MKIISNSLIAHKQGCIVLYNFYDCEIVLCYSLELHVCLHLKWPLLLVLVEKTLRTYNYGTIRSWERQTPAVHQFGLMDKWSGFQFWFANRKTLFKKLLTKTFQVRCKGKTINSRLPCSIMDAKLRITHMI